jgi:hypothetical protein
MECTDGRIKSEGKEIDGATRLPTPGHFAGTLPRVIYAVSAPLPAGENFLIFIFTIF